MPLQMFEENLNGKFHVQMKGIMIKSGQQALFIKNLINKRCYWIIELPFGEIDDYIMINNAAVQSVKFSGSKILNANKICKYINPEQNEDKICLIENPQDLATEFEFFKVIPNERIKLCHVSDLFDKKLHGKYCIPCKLTNSGEYKSNMNKTHFIINGVSIDTKFSAILWNSNKRDFKAGSEVLLYNIQRNELKNKTYMQLNENSLLITDFCAEFKNAVNDIFNEWTNEPNKGYYYFNPTAEIMKLNGFEQLLKMMKNKKGVYEIETTGLKFNVDKTQLTIILDKSVTF